MVIEFGLASNKLELVLNELKVVFNDFQVVLSLKHTCHKMRINLKYNLKRLNKKIQVN